MVKCCSTNEAEKVSTGTESRHNPLYEMFILKEVAYKFLKSQIRLFLIKWGLLLKCLG
jgi:hypothetical protein